MMWPCVCLQACTTTLNQFSVIGGLRVEVKGVEECCRQCMGGSFSGEITLLLQI